MVQRGEGFSSARGSMLSVLRISEGFQSVMLVMMPLFS